MRIDTSQSKAFASNHNEVQNASKVLRQPKRKLKNLPRRILTLHLTRLQMMLMTQLKPSTAYNKTKINKHIKQETYI